MSDCLTCGAPTRVEDSRKRGNGLKYRKRFCTKCPATHSTYEVPFKPGENSDEILKWAMEEIVADLFPNRS